MKKKTVIKTLIVDDESPAREELKYLLSNFPHVLVIGEAEDGEDAYNKILGLRPDLVMLDIQMPGIDGFQVLNRLINKVELPRIIFVTAYDQYAVNAFEINAVDYLLKPIEMSRLTVSIDRVRTSIENNVETTDTIREILQKFKVKKEYVKRLTLKKGRHYPVIDVDNIFYISIEDGIVKVFGENVSGSTNYRSLDELLQDLDPAKFYRAHRAYIVNIDKIAEIIPWFSGSFKLRLKKPLDMEIPLSRIQAKQLRKILKW